MLTTLILCAKLSDVDWISFTSILSGKQYPFFSWEPQEANDREEYTYAKNSMGGWLLGWLSHIMNFILKMSECLLYSQRLLLPLLFLAPKYLPWKLPVLKTLLFSDRADMNPYLLVLLDIKLCPVSRDSVQGDSCQECKSQVFSREDTSRWVPGVDLLSEAREMMRRGEGEWHWRECGGSLI